MNEKCLDNTVNFSILAVLTALVVAFMGCFVIWTSPWMAFRLGLLCVGVYLVLRYRCKRFEDATDS